MSGAGDARVVRSNQHFQLMGKSFLRFIDNLRDVCTHVGFEICQVLRGGNYVVCGSAVTVHIIAVFMKKYAPRGFHHPNADSGVQGNSSLLIGCAQAVAQYGVDKIQAVLQAMRGFQRLGPP